MKEGSILLESPLHTVDLPGPRLMTRLKQAQVTMGRQTPRIDSIERPRDMRAPYGETRD